MLIQSCYSGGALTGVAHCQDEVEGFRHWTGREKFVDEAAADSKPNTAARWWSSAPIVLGNLQHGKKKHTCWLLLRAHTCTHLCFCLRSSSWLPEFVFVVVLHPKTDDGKGLQSISTNNTTVAEWLLLGSIVHYSPNANTLSILTNRLHCLIMEEGDFLFFFGVLGAALQCSCRQNLFRFRRADFIYLHISLNVDHTFLK